MTRKNSDRILSMNAPDQVDRLKTLKAHLQSNTGKSPDQIAGYIVLLIDILLPNTDEIPARSRN